MPTHRRPPAQRSPTAAPRRRRPGPGLGARWRLLSARLPTGPLLLVAAGLVAVAALRLEPADAGATEPAVVARAELDAGSIVGDADVEVRRLPIGTAPPGALAEVEAAVGRQVTAPILAGEPLVDARLAPAGLTGLAAATPAGWLTFAVPSDGAVAAAEVGQAVDLFALDPRASPAATDADARRLASDAVVVGVADDHVAVAVPATDGPAVAAALVQTTVVVAIRGPTDR